MNDHYEKDAFDSTKPRELPESDTSKLKSWPLSVERKRKIPWGIFIGDYTSLFGGDDIKDLKGGERRWEISIDRIEIVNWRNPHAAVKAIRGTFLIFLVIMIVINTFDYLSNPATYLLDLTTKPDLFLIEGIIVVSLVICTLLLKVVPDKNNVVLSRRRGTIWMPKMRKHPAKEIPFDEFDAYTFSHVNPKSGVTWYVLHLGHRYSRRGIDFSEWVYEHNVYLYWEFLQQHMDISRPLPDIPQYETRRALDPTTAAYDKKTKRPPHFWRDQDPKQVERLSRAAYKRAKNFNWLLLPRGSNPYEGFRLANMWRSHVGKEAGANMRPESLWANNEKKSETANKKKRVVT